jgi:serine/threonine protein kinase/tetratricopeptide (TPR) repeat protein
VPGRDPERGSRIGPYEVLGPLGRGGMATVLEVRDTRDDRIRALKLLHGDLPGEEARKRFSIEFRTLSSLEHPNILRVFDSGVHEGAAWFAMEKLGGQDLRQAMDELKKLPPARRAVLAEKMLIDIASALAHIHEQGLVHRDVTPGNIRLLPDRALLMDFGVVHTPGAELTIVGEMVGTVAYIAPEQISAEISGGRVDARADLYSLGCVLYLMLTGQRPFSARTIPSLLEKQLNAQPRPPRELVPTVPPHLDTICLRLLEKDPAQRYGSARHLLSILDRRASALQAVDLKTWPPRLVGRIAEAARMREALASLASGKGGCMLVEAPPGFGKTRLLQLMGEQAASLHLPVARGLCRRGKTTPYGGFKGVLQDLLEGQPIPPGPLARAFGDEEGSIEQYKVLTAFRDLLRQRLPRALLIDQLHYADRGTLALLEFLLRNHLSLADEPLLILLSRRPPEGLDDPLEELLYERSAGVELQQMPLGPITSTDVEELLLQLVPPDERTSLLASRLHREGEGNPHFIGEMIRGLVEQGIITEEEPGHYVLGLDVTHVSRAALPIPASIREALEERLGTLSAGGMALAQVLSLCRSEVTAEVLEEALGLPSTQLLDRLEELLDQHVVRARHVGVEELYDLAQPRLREVLVATLQPGESALLHRRLGTALERLNRHRMSAVLEAVAWHFEQGDVPAKACPYLLRAGVRLRERAFVSESLDFLDRALALEPHAREFMTLDDADRQLARLHHERGQALRHLGDWAGALREHSAADRLGMQIDDVRIRTVALTELGNLARRQLRIEDAESNLSEALALATKLGDHKLRVMPLLGLGAVRWARGDLDGSRQIWLEGMVAANAAANEEARGRALNGMGLVAFCRGQAAEARRHLEDASDIFNRLGKLSPLVIVRVNLVELYHCTGNLRKGLQLADRTIAQAREISYSYGIALGLQYRSLLLVDLGRWGEAEDNATQARRIAEDLGDSEDQLTIVASLIRIALGRGDLDAAQAHLDEADELLLQDDIEGYGPLVAAWQALVHAHRGAHDAMDDALELAEARAGRSWPHQACRLDIIAARALGQAGRSDQACVRAHSALKRADACGYRFYSLKAHILLARHATQESRLAMHRRVATALSKSLAGNLGREDARHFLERHAVEPSAS